MVAVQKVINFDLLDAFFTLFPKKVHKKIAFSSKMLVTKQTLLKGRFFYKQSNDYYHELFETITHKLIEENYITLENYFLDGTKIEADANKYSFVWKKATSKFEAKLKEKIQETLKHIHAITELEAEENQTKINPDTEMSEQDLVEIANTLEGKVEQLTEEIEKETDSSVRKEIRKERTELKKYMKKIREDFIPRMAKYKEQNEIFGDRNS